MSIHTNTQIASAPSSSAICMSVRHPHTAHPYRTRDTRSCTSSPKMFLSLSCSTSPRKIIRFNYYGRCVSSPPRPPDPLGLSGTALCCRLFFVLCAVWSACGMAVWTLTSARLWSVGRAGPCVSFPKFPGTFVFGCRLRRACASGVGKLQITNYKLLVLVTLAFACRVGL